MSNEKIIYTGGDAFPTLDSSYETNNNDFKHVSSSGMTLRDYFAAKELSKNDGVTINDAPVVYERLANHCYQMADAMLKARGHQ